MDENVRWVGQIRVRKGEIREGGNVSREKKVGR
jgi:hypothetical protein